MAWAAVRWLSNGLGITYPALLSYDKICSGEFEWLMVFWVCFAFSSFLDPHMEASFGPYYYACKLLFLWWLQSPQASLLIQEYIRPYVRQQQHVGRTRKKQHSRSSDSDKQKPAPKKEEPDFLGTIVTFRERFLPKEESGPTPSVSPKEPEVEEKPETTPQKNDKKESESGDTGAVSDSKPPKAEGRKEKQVQEVKEQPKTDASETLSPLISTSSASVSDSTLEEHSPTAGSNSKLLTEPRRRLVFNGPFTEKLVYWVRLTNNNGAKRLAWVAKTNHLTRLSLEPSCGVLQPHSSALIEARCEPFDWELNQSAKHPDRFTFEQRDVPDDAGDEFDLDWFKTEGVTYRKRLIVQYNQ